MEKDNKMSYESAMSRLEEIVAHLENNDIPLDEGMKLFEEGTALVSKCSKMLKEAEQKITKLTKE